VYDLGAGPVPLRRFADHDAQDRAELAALGITTEAADKNVVEGIKYCFQKFAVMPNKKPRLRIFNTCKNVKRELRRYEWDKRKDVDMPRKAKGNDWIAGVDIYTDDAMDTMRYGLFSDRNRNVKTIRGSRMQRHRPSMM
jgi:hypothetical protein